MKRILLLLAFLFITIAINAQNFVLIGNTSRYHPDSPAVKMITDFFSQFRSDTVGLNRLAYSLQTSEVDLIHFVDKIRESKIVLTSTYKIFKDGSRSLMIYDDASLRDTIELYDSQTKKVDDYALSLWIFYRTILVNQPAAAFQPPSGKHENERSRNENFSQIFSDAYRKYLIKLNNTKIPPIDFEINCVNKLLPDRYFNRLVAKDASYLITDGSGKLKQSNISIDLLNPKVGAFNQLKLPKKGLLFIPNDSAYNSLQVGIALKLDQPLDITNYKKLNFRGVASFQWDKILKRGNYHFDDSICRECIIDGYRDTSLTENNIYDSLYSRINWNTKKMQWLSFRLDDIYKSYNLYDEDKKDSLFHGIQLGFNFEFSWNIHHYVNPAYNGTDKTSGNWYLRMGASLSLSNNIENENLKGIDFETYQNVTDSSKRLVSKLNAFGEDDFRHEKLTASPFVEGFITNKKRNAGLHASIRYFAPLGTDFTSNQSLICSFGVFASIPKNNFTDLIHKEEGSSFNIEVLFTSGNFFKSEIRNMHFWGGIFTPELKFDIPFRLLN